MALSYDVNTDYQALINESVANNDLTSAAEYEQLRNAKITGENMTGVDTTDLYSQYYNLGSSSSDTATASTDTSTTTSSYTNSYTDAIAAALEELQGSTWSYDADNDDAAALTEQYTSAGQDAMQNTLAQVASRTGGMASSYATTASNQAYNDYMEGLSSALSDLESSKYAEWQNEQDSLYNLISLYSSLGSAEESSYYSALSAAMAQQEYDDAQAQQTYENETAASQYLDYLAQQGYENTTSAGQYADALAQQEYENTTSASDSDKAYAYEIAMSVLSSGAMPSDELLTKAGISTTDAQAIYTALNTTTTTTYSGSGGTGTTTDGSTETTGYEALYADAYASGNPANYIASNYKNYGLTSSTGLSDGYESWVESQATAAKGYSSNDADVVSAAANYYAANPTVTLDSYTLDYYLSSQGIEGSAANLFKEALATYGATYSRR